MKPALLTVVSVHLFLATAAKGMGDAFEETAVDAVASLKGGGESAAERTLFGKPRAGRSSTFTVSVLGEQLPHTIEVYGVELGTVSVAVTMQGAEEDAARATPGFDLIARTLDVRPGTP